MQAGGAGHTDMGLAVHPAKKAPDAPCKSGMPCQAAVAAVILPEVVAFTRLAIEPATLVRPEQALVLSRPPDPGLRPPIQL